MGDNESHVAASSDDSTEDILDETILMITLRRDFPLRAGEKNGDWQWTNARGERIQEKMRWSKPEEAPLEPDIDLTAETERAIYGWNIGDPDLGSEGDGAGQYTTDHSNPIGSTVQLVRRTERTEGDTIEFERETIREATTTTNTQGNFDRSGEILLSTGGLTGDFIITILPDDLYDGEAGPDLGEESNAPLILYNSVDIQIRLEQGFLVNVSDPYDPPEGKTGARIGNRQKFKPSTTHLPVSLKPVWWNHLGGFSRAQGDIDLFVIHRTNGGRLGNAINRFFGSNDIGAHYIMEADGHIIKLCKESKEVVHAQSGRWGGRAWNQRTNKLDYSIGIETINPNQENVTSYPAYSTRGNPPYTSEQYRALSVLITQIIEAHPHIGCRIVGHCDVATGPPRAGTPNDCYSVKRFMDPGTHFEWERLEGDGLGMRAGENHFDVESSYEGIFHTFRGLELRENDRDPHGSNPAILGGHQRTGIRGQPVRDLQQDLSYIGYSLRVNGGFDSCTAGAVDRFKRHFFSGSRGGMTGGTINRETAEMIKNVAEEVMTSNWECWLQTVTRAINVKFHRSATYHGQWRRGLIGVYRTRDEAAHEADVSDSSVWEKSNGTFECWIVKTSQAMRFKFYSGTSHRAGERGLIGVYSREESAEFDLSSRSERSGIWRKRRT